jgi:hypothetical protein
LDIRDPVVQVEDLALAIELALDGVADDVVVVARDVGAHRQAIDRRGLDDAEVADAGQRHLQGARDRRRGHRHDVDQRPQLLDLLLVLDAEAVLFVDHQQAEVLELHVGLQQAVGADDDVDLPGGEAAQGLALLGGGLEARQRLDPHRVALAALAEGDEVLLGEDRGRHQHRHLAAVHHRQEGGPQRHLGLAVADVAADQAVHRLAAAHVAEHVVDRLLLVRRLLEREGRLELAEVAVGLQVGVAGVDLAGGVDGEQLLGHGEDRLAGLLLHPIPAAAAEAVEGGHRALGADVLLHQADAVDRQVEAVAAGVLEVQVVALGAGDLQVAQAAIDADPVVEVDDEVLRLELAQALQQLRHRHPPRRPPPDLAEDIRLGDDHQTLLGDAEAFAEMAEHDLDAGGAPALAGGRADDEIGERPGAHRGRDLVGLEQARQALRLRLGAGDEHHPLALVAPGAHLVGDRGEAHLVALMDARRPEVAGRERVHRQSAASTSRVSNSTAGCAASAMRQALRLR